MPNITINHAITYTYVEKGDNKGARDKQIFPKRASLKWAMNFKEKIGIKHCKWRPIWAWSMFGVAPKKYYSVTDNQIEAIPSYYRSRVLLSFFLSFSKYGPRKKILVQNLSHSRFLI